MHRTGTLRPAVNEEAGAGTGIGVPVPVPDGYGGSGMATRQPHVDLGQGSRCSCPFKLAYFSSVLTLDRQRGYR